ncbi:MAG: GTPase HflX [Mesorhizobium sp.]|uniref:GTPase HflX n=1 Tax=Mesorhizobium opportunistum (strain LMG 24607 / HAMBI 3007 / WSM2075) TaxID=536019 RepID=F7YCR1_MESOW|nr:GTPase HflX [Mesorhizobium opportunistum]AEH88951.1 GTP-binding proten HflX [Mesorhizobium opportunistum WSM2075]TJV03319.1 MAG: GTPase HflX [Mesorhizobium sp.]
MAREKDADATVRGKPTHHPGTEADGPTRAVVIVPVLTRQPRGDDETNRPRLTRSADARHDEAVGLARAINLDPVHTAVVTVNDPRPATLLGSGKVEEFAEIVKERHAELVIVDHPLTPVQQRNLEKELNAKVLDRTGLILEIFGERARTKEGTLQVELAHLNYQKGRLVRSWTHLERQRGGAGFLGGPGETQIESDRRQLQEKIIKLKHELETVRRTRDLHRAKRKKVPFPVVAIVGYTNAGKSTLFNRLTGADVLAQDMLFATLDPTLRRVRLPHGTPIILSDTVGFISDLPTHLIAAFRATLEEVVEADLVIHLRDISDPDTAAQAEDVERILADLGVDAGDAKRVIEVWNKIDQLDEGNRSRLLAPDMAKGGAAGSKGPPIAVSAVTGEGIDALKAIIETRMAGELEDLTVTIEPAQFGLVDWLYRNGDIVSRTDNEDGSATISLKATHSAREEIESRLRRKNNG